MERVSVRCGLYDNTLKWLTDIYFFSSLFFVAGSAAALSSLLETPLIPVGFSGKYPTKSGKLVVPGMAGEADSLHTKLVVVARPAQVSSF